MKQKQNITPVFIVGCPRSGTTLLQAMLSSHPEVISFPETHFFSYLRNPVKIKHHLGVSNKVAVDHFLNEFQEKQLKLSEVKPRELQTARSYRAHIRLLRKMLDAAAVKNKARVWVEKTPNHLHHLKLIERNFKDAVILHIIRSGEATISSLYKASNEYPESWSGKRSLDRCIFRWRYDIRFQQRFIGKKNHYFCFYEDLISDKNEKVLSEICRLMGVEYDPRMATDYAESFSQIVKEEEHHKANVKRPLNQKKETSSISLSAEELEKVRQRIADIDLSAFR